MTPRILFLTTEQPWPLDGGGKLRTFETLACLSSFASVTVVSVTESATPEADRAALGARLPGVELLPAVPHPVRIRRRPAFLLRTAAVGLARNLPYLAAKFESGPYRRLASRLARTVAPDVVWCDHLNLFATAEAVRRAAPGRPALVLDEHNVESDLFRRAAGAGVLAAAARLEAVRAERFERRALRHADRTVAISDADAARLAGLGGDDRVRTVLPSAGELGPPRPPPPPGGPAVFLASLSWPPNAEAARFLALEILPRLRARMPAARVRIGGRGLGAGDERALRAAGAELPGFVSDAEVFHRESSAAAVPVLSGSGISMKLLDALKADVPVVSTSVGARGLLLVDGSEALVADGADAFAAALARALTDDGLRARLVAGGRAYLERNHGRAAIGKAYARIVEEALARARR